MEESEDNDCRFSPTQSHIAQDPVRVIEDLLFEVKVERLKNDKLKREWQQRKSLYETQLDELKLESNLKTQVLERMDREMDNMRTKMNDICEAYQQLERESDDIKLQNNAQTKLITTLQAELAKVKSQDQGYSALIDKYKARNEAYEKQIMEAKQQITNIASYFSQIIDNSSGSFSKQLDFINERLRCEQFKVKKLRLQIQKIQVERAFLKEKARHSRFTSITKSKQSDEDSEDLYTLKNSVCMFRDTSHTKTLEDEIPYSPREQPSGKENLPRMVTFGEVKYINDESGEALEDARTLIKYKSDKEFLSKVLDAQLRVSKVEQKQGTKKKQYDFGQMCKNKK